MRNYFLVFFVLGPIFISASYVAAPLTSLASTVDDLKSDIDAKSREIEAIEKEIQEYRNKLNETEKGSQTLKRAISQVDLTLKKLNSNIRLTDARIARTRLEIRELGGEIKQKTKSIENARVSLSSLLVLLSRKDEEGLLWMTVKYESLASFFSFLYSIAGVERGLQEKLTSLRSLKEELESSRLSAESKNRELAELLVVLGGERALQAAERRGRAELLKETQNQEKKYQAFLREQEEKRAALEEEIREIEQKIRFTLDPSSIPTKGSGVLGWSLPEISLKSCWNGGGGVKNCITQFFGRTDFSARGGYNGKGHNGADFRADIGTPVFAAERGAIIGAGDTDLGCRGASYGKWILIRHPSNLATLYSHLSSIHVAKGQEVARGDRIALSGKSGYATGPHLHFSVFVADAVDITSIRSRVCGREMVLPIAPIGAYLNPLDYL